MSGSDFATQAAALDRLIVMLERHAQREQVAAGKLPPALFRPSSGSRWLACHGSTQLALRSPKERKPSHYAQEGTAAHKVAELALIGERQPTEWVDRQVRLDGDAGLEGWFVDAEMAESVQTYLDAGKLWFDEAGGECRPLVEARLSLGALDPTDPFLSEVAGTADHLILDYRNRRIIVRDLKYGKGVRVKASSPQPRLYGLMALVTYDAPPGGWQQVICEIVQPRLPNEDDWVTQITYTPDQLMGFLGEVYDALIAATQPDAPLTPDPTGDYCRWCPAAGQCPALADRALRAGQDAFAQSPLAIVTPNTPVAVPPQAGWTLPDPAGVSPGDLANWLDSEDPIVAWFTAVKQRAAQLSMAGVTVPGWKMVARTSHRRYKNKDEAIAELYKAGLEEADVYAVEKEAPMRTPRQVEERFTGARKKDVKELIEKLTERPAGEPTLVRAGDKREAVGSVFPALAEG